ncbi:hypothetical protein [Glacieibacterium sp.]|uniref:hypothetical protein n=1 Tax=Glacieibacterium sp. TaxID=2860237 RepID=UPI003B00CA8E
MADRGGPSQMGILTFGCLGIIGIALLLYLMWTYAETADAAPLPDAPASVR